MKSTLIVMPTGTGKTVVMGAIASRWPTGRILILAHREELVFQAAEKIGQMCNEHCGVEMADASVSEGEDWKPRIVVASVQTLNAKRKKQWRMKKFDPAEFSLVMTDEAHHATATTYQRIYEWMGKNPSMRHLGVTATPDRTDEEALGQVFDTVAYDYEILNAIDDGWLVPIEQHFTMVDGLDLSSCKSHKNDLQDSDVARAMLQEGPLHEVASAVQQLSEDRPTLIFTAAVEHAVKVAEILNRHEPDSAVAIHGKTPKDERREHLKSYSRGEFQYLVNMGVFLEGFDAPQIGCVANARPTKSRSLYAQVIGRGTRPLAGVVDGLPDAEARRKAIYHSAKPGLLVLDFVGNSGRHKLVSTADILSGNETDKVIDWAVAEVQRQGGRADMREALKLARIRVEDEERRAREQAAKRKSITPRAKVRTQKIDPFAALDMVPSREPGWFKGKKPSERQQAVLRKFKVSDDAIAQLSAGQAGELMTELITRAKAGKCSLKQANLLGRFGLSKHLSFAQASKAITAIAGNGWRGLPNGYAAPVPAPTTAPATQTEESPF